MPGGGTLVRPATPGRHEPVLTGLSTAEAADRLRSAGPNSIPEPPAVGVLTPVLHQLRDPMILLLLAAAVVTMILRDVTDLVVIARWWS